MMGHMRRACAAWEFVVVVVKVAPGATIFVYCAEALLISSLAEGRTDTPQTRKMPAPTGPTSGRIAVKKGHPERSKQPTRRTF